MSYKEYQSPSFLEAYKNAFVSCLDFDGRSRRAEYWKYILVYYFFIIVTFAICFVINTIISDADSICKGILIVFFLAHILPNLSICARRLHDSGHSAKWLIVSCIPYIGAPFGLWVFFCLFKDSDEDENNWGESPKYYVENE